METVDKIYRDLFKKRKVWNYYPNIDDMSSLLYPFESNDLARSVEFITTYFRNASKNETSFQDYVKSFGKRSQHVVSTFFLGFYFYNNSRYIKEHINKELLKYQENNSTINFAFVWFLICFFHDLGYQIEDNDTLIYKSFKDFFENRCKNVTLNESEGIPNLYEDIYRAYFDYIIKERQKNEHGICAAFVVFKDLCEIRKKAPNKLSLCWDKSLIDVYNFVSWIILAHNIWYATSNDLCNVAKYYCAGLKKLIRDEGDYKISFEEYPTFFLFCLVDSIEFLKRVQDVSLLKDIKLGIEEDNDKCTIVVESNLKCGCKDRVLNSCKDLEWLTKTVKNGDKVKIYLNS